MKKLLSLVAVMVLTLGLTTVISTPAQASVPWTMKSPFAREIVRPGDMDRDTYNIEHVYELQYRLKWVGLFDGAPTGYFGPSTERALKQFQRRRNLKPTGVATYRVWKALIVRTIRNKDGVRHICKTAGWHTCYDRSKHQVNLYHDGTLLNSWLVRGGGYSTQTRTGNFKVQWRDKDHRSSMFDDAPMPYSQFFSRGQALHGSRYMMDPFVEHSHGCVNFWVEDARQLWNMTSNKVLNVHVYGSWD